jgi:hypothetical protein
MRKIVWLLALCTLWFFLLFSNPVNSYELDDTDYDIIENIDSKVIDFIDSRENISAEKVVEVFTNFLNTRELNERLLAILETVIDDIKYEYYLEEYAEGSIEEDDCYDDEYFDIEDLTCYLIDEEDLNDDNDYLDLDEHSDRSEEFAEEEEDILAIYEITKNNIVLLEWEHTEENKEIWELFVKIIPVAYRGDFKNYTIFNNSDSDTAAHVAQNENNNKKWDLTVNLYHFQWENGQLDIIESTETLIHEYAHVLTLGKTQVRYTPLDAWDTFLEKAKEDCQAYFIWEGCLNTTSYFHAFISSFWQENFEASQDEEEDDFYTGKETSFVSDYAATNPWEDIAESFVHFILQSQPTGETLAQKKILFFYDYPELVKLRDFIRMRIKK